MAQKRDRKKNLGKEVRKKYRAQKRNSAISAFFVLLTCVAVVAMVWLEIIPDKYSVSVGEISQEKIVATGEATDPEKTRLSRQEAMNAVADIYANMANLRICIVVEEYKVSPLQIVYAGYLRPV